MASRLQRGVLDTPQLTHCLELIIGGDVLEDDVDDGLGSIVDVLNDDGDDGDDEPRL